MPFRAGFVRKKIVTSKPQEVTIINDINELKLKLINQTTTLSYKIQIHNVVLRFHYHL